MNSTSEIVVNGHAHPRFAAVKDAFARNLLDRGEIGAAVSAYLDGEPVFELWGGETIAADGSRTPWQRDTIVRMNSVNKGVTAICLHMLADRGLVDFDKPVAFYWPEFAQSGKERITLGQLVSGLAALVFPDKVPDGMGLDWDAIVTGLADQEPAWEPGTQGAYHSSTYGHLVGEVVRRISGKRPGQFFRDEIGEPLGIDYWFTVPPEEQARVSVLLSNPESVTLNTVAQGDNPLARAWRALPAGGLDDTVTPEMLAIEMPSAFGRGNGMAIAKLFAALSVGGALDGVRLMSPKSVERLRTLQWDGTCGLTGRHFRYAMGMFLSTPVYAPMGPNPATFGHIGAGGSVAFADPDKRLSFGYSTNFMCSGVAVGDRCEALVDATYACFD